MGGDKLMKFIKEELLKNPDVTSVGKGYKYVNGKKTKKVCVVVGVKKKKPKSAIRPNRVIPPKIKGVVTDVQERDIKALSIPLPSMTAMPTLKPRGLVQRMRPCPPGFSIGHVKITAGTLGAYVKRGQSDDYVILSNNHVLANSNDAQPNDVIIQPGQADGGFSGTDQFAWLEEFAVIRWDGDDGGGCNLAKRFAAWRHRAQRVEQPYPNLIDAAIARPVNQGYVRLDYPFGIGQLKGVKDLQLGDSVQKAGRTTEHTRGTVEGVDTTTRVQYGSGKIATFADQIEVRSDEEFSAGGDSGSAILTDDGYIGALLFAGGSGVTIGNRISNVISVLGIRI
jgi:hypothetical protein